MGRQAGIWLGIAGVALGFGFGFLAGSPPPSNRPAREAASRIPPAPGSAGAAVYEALLVPDPFARTAALGEVLSGLRPEDLDSVRVAYDAVVTGPADPEIAMLAQWWAQHDPQGAWEWATTTRQANDETVQTAVLRTWARQDPAAASLATSRMNNPAMARPAIVAVALGWEEGGHPQLPEFLVTMPQSVELQMAIDTIARRKALRHNPEEALRWAESLPPDSRPGGVKVNAMRRVAGAVAEIDPEAAMAFAKEHGETPSGKSIYRRVGLALVETDGERTMQWLGTLPDGREQEAAVGAVYRTWIGQDKTAAMRWLRGQETQPWLDPAIHAFAQALSFEDPELAMEWAQQIRNEQRRNDATWRVGKIWWESDPARAKVWLDQADLPERLQRLISGSGPRRKAPDKPEKTAPGEAPGA